MLRHSIQRSKSLRPSIFQPLVRTNFTTTNKAIVWISDKLQLENRGKYIFGFLLFGAGTIFGARTYNSAKLNERNRCIILESSFNRSVGDQLLTLPMKLAPTSFLASNISSNDPSQAFTTNQRISLHGLLLQMISKHQKGCLKEEEIFQITQSILPLVNNPDQSIRSKVAELLLLFIDSGFIHETFLEGPKDATQENNILRALVDLTVIPNPESITSGAFSPTTNQTVSSAMSKLINRSPSLANELLQNCGMKFISLISHSRKEDKLFFVPFCESIADQIKDTNSAEVLVKDGLIPFLNNAVNPGNSEKIKILAETSAIKLPSFRSDDKYTVAAKQKIYQDVSRCIGNIAAVSTPHLAEKIIEEGVLDILEQINGSARLPETLCFIARCIANLSANVEMISPIVNAPAGWVGILEHWVLAECHRSVTSKAKMSPTELLSKDAILQGASFETIETEAEKRRLTEISLCALGNLASNRKVTENISRTTILREVTDYLKSDPNSSTQVRIQFSRLISILSHHNIPMVLNRIQTLVGIDGMLTILENDSSERSQFYIARCLGDLVEQLPFAKLIESQDPLGWELIEKIIDSPSLSVQREVARTLANLVAGVGSKTLSKNEKLRNILEQWSKSKDTVLSDNALRALASLMGSEVGSAKYAEGVHLMYPQTEFTEDSKFDVVFLHGVGGDPLGTWRVGENNNGWCTQKS